MQLHRHTGSWIRREPGCSVVGWPGARRTALKGGFLMRDAHKISLVRSAA